MNEEQPKPAPEAEEQETDAPAPKEKESGLKVNYTRPIVGKNCPNCDAAMAENAVLCMACGYNTNTGLVTEMAKPHPGKKKRRRKKHHGPVSLLINTLILLLLAAAAYGYVHYEGLLVKYRDRLPAALAEKLPARAKRPMNPQWLQDVTQQHLLKSCRTVIKEEIDEKYPLFAENDEVTIETKSGKSGTGRFLDTKNGSAFFVTANGATASIPLKDLTIESRLRSDPEGRETYIEKMAQARVDEILSPFVEETEVAPEAEPVQVLQPKKISASDPLLELGKQSSGKKSKRKK